MEWFKVWEDGMDGELYMLDKNYKKFRILRERGYVWDGMKGMIEGRDGFVFESNDDVDMLGMWG